MKTIPKPLTLKAARKLADDNDQIAVVLSLELGELIGTGDTEALNDLIDDKIADNSAFTLSDISYRVVGHKEGKSKEGYLSGKVLIEVIGTINSMED